jgi:hypothetical protein
VTGVGELSGGPLDGLLFDIAALDRYAEEHELSAVAIDLSSLMPAGTKGHACYRKDDGRWVFAGMAPARDDGRAPPPT